MINSTLCYIEKDGKYLMLCRNRKKNDCNFGKWIGVGGKLEEGEGPENCLLREVREETGLLLTDYRIRGIVTFVSDKWETEQMYLFTAVGFEGELCGCDEGTLEWVSKSKISELSLWAGDRIFLRLITEEVPFFLLRLAYHGDELISAILDGKELIDEKK